MVDTKQLRENDVRYVAFAGWQLSKVGLGTSQFANPGWGYGADHDPQELVQRAVALGMNHFDTFSLYGSGHSERILGTALQGVEGVRVASKVFTFAPSARLVTTHVRASVERLGRPLDLCYLQWPNPFITDRSLMAGMQRLQAEGLISEIGVSNYGLDRWQAAERHLGTPVLVDQVTYNLVDRHAEEDLLPWATAEGRLLVAAQPLGGGFLSGAYHRGKRVTGSWRTPDPLYSSGNLNHTAELIGALGEVARAHDATAAQVALAYVLHHPNMVAIPGAATPSQLAENAAAADLELSEDEWRGLAEAASRYRPLGPDANRLGLHAAKHWVRGVRLMVATMKEDRRF